MIPTSHFHPMMVHFPIAIVTIGFLIELSSLWFKKEICLSKFGFYLLIIGTLAAIPALLTGILFTDEMSGSAGEIQETHELFAWLTMGVLAVTSILRIILNYKNKEESSLKWLVFALYALAAIFVGITGFYGGTLVYNYMMPL
jgi:uncharacterized membrane protein